MFNGGYDWPTDFVAFNVLYIRSLYLLLESVVNEVVVVVSRTSTPGTFKHLTSDEPFTSFTQV